jgi:GAF domain-containing protein
LLEGDQASTPAYSGQRALRLDEEQYRTGTGPCLDAAAFGEAISLAMAGLDQPYPDFQSAARREGVTHTLSIGLATGDHAVGALNIYSATGDPLSEESDRIARTVATCVGIVLANVDRYRQAATLAAQLEVALHSRASIDQAKGILIARHGCSSEEAFKILIRRSQAQNVKLRLLAQDLVEDAAQA